jgi:hypothetical protein
MLNLNREFLEVLASAKTNISSSYLEAPFWHSDTDILAPGGSSISSAHFVLVPLIRTITWYLSRSFRYFLLTVIVEILILLTTFPLLSYSLLVADEGAFII